MKWSNNHEMQINMYAKVLERLFFKENFPSVTKFPLRDISFSINKYKTIWNQLFLFSILIDWTMTQNFTNYRQVSCCSFQII